MHEQLEDKQECTEKTAAKQAVGVREAAVCCGTMATLK